MNDFLANAESIFETALTGEGEVSILIEQNGAIRMMDSSDWPLDSLQAHHGARAAYRVRRSGGVVRVEGKSATSSCLLQSEPPAKIARRMLADRPRYVLTT